MEHINTYKYPLPWKGRAEKCAAGNGTWCAAREERWNEGWRCLLSLWDSGCGLLPPVNELEHHESTETGNWLLPVRLRMLLVVLDDFLVHNSKAIQGCLETILLKEGSLIIDLVLTKACNEYLTHLEFLLMSKPGCDPPGEGTALGGGTALYTTPEGTNQHKWCLDKQRTSPSPVLYPS